MKALKKLVAATLLLALSLSLFVFNVSADEADMAWGAATVDASTLNIRSGPGTDYDRVSVVSGGTIIVVLEQTNDEWYKVNYAGKIGYASTEYLTEILRAENFKATGTVKGDDVRMRSGHSTDDEVIATYSSGKEVNIIGINEGWYKVEEEEGTGYIRSDYVDVTGGASYATVSTLSDGSVTTRSVDTESASLGEQIANYALQFVGYNYVYGEESPSRGFDCSGLTWYVYKQFGYSLERRASLQYANNGVKISKDELQKGDLVFFSSNGSGVTHVGMYIGNGQFVHASTSKVGVIISDLGSSYYTRVYWGAKRII